jgi:hypothetical protein
MSVKFLSVFSVLLSYSRDGVERVLVALTPRSDAQGVHIPLMFIPKSRMDLTIQRKGVNSGMSYYYGKGPHPWDYQPSDAGDVYFHDCKDSLTPKQREAARGALAQLVKEIMSGETEPKVGAIGPANEVARLAEAPSSAPEDYVFES